LPTAHEQGLLNFNGDSWNAVFLPKDTSPAITMKLNAALVAAIETPALAQLSLLKEKSE